MYDAVIIGAGVTGCAIARELSMYRANICVLEREEDVCCGTSKANSAIVHAGFDAKPGTLKAKLNVLGNARIEALSKELDFPFDRNGSLVVCTRQQDSGALYELLRRGGENGVPGLRILSRSELIMMEPNLSDDVTSALYAPTGAIVCPFEMTIALAENACENGTAFFLHTEVTDIRKKEDGYIVMTGNAPIEARTVINAAGVYADALHNMVSRVPLSVTPRKGEYKLLDKSAGDHVRHTIFQLPGKMGKGVLVTPTVHGNLLVGPTSIDIADKEDLSTTADGLASLTQAAAKSVKEIPFSQVITSFAGLRAHEESGDFVIGQVPDAPGFFDAAGIESPGLSSAPAIGEMVAGMVAEYLSLRKKDDAVTTRTGILRPSDMTQEERSELIRKNPAYGNILCRCEMISEGEILDAICRPLGARSLDAVKRRTRAGMGRCQAGFCSPRVMELLAREVPMEMGEVTKNGGGSHGGV